eukprot:1819863-Prymnesium_polylepis.1
MRIAYLIVQEWAMRRDSATGFLHGHGPRLCRDRSATSSGRRAEQQQVCIRLGDSDIGGEH